MTKSISNKNLNKQLDNNNNSTASVAAATDAVYDMTLGEEEQEDEDEAYAASLVSSQIAVHKPISRHGSSSQNYNDSEYTDTYDVTSL